MMKKILLFLLSAVILMSCGGAKKQGLEDAPQITEEDSLSEVYESEEILDTIIPSPEVKYKEERKVDSSNPPVKLNLAGRDKEDRKLDVADYYSKVHYVKLKHPLPPEQGGFLGNANFLMMYDQGASSGRGLNSVIYMTNDRIIAGDHYFGYHSYDKDGNFDYSIVTMNKLPAYNREANEVTIHWDKSLKMIRSFSVLGDNCLFLTSEGEKFKLLFHNLTKKRNYLERPAWGGELRLLNPTTFVSYAYRVLDDEAKVFFASLDYKGDVLCNFTNYNSLVKPGKSSYTNPDRRFLYYYNDQLTMRQSYNDTIYRMVSEQKLKPVYVMDFGDRKLDVATGLYGDKSNSLIPYGWLETEDFVFLVYTSNYDCPNNRNNGSVKFYYNYYDKNSKKLYNIPSTKLPEEQLIENSIENGIPLIGNNTQANGKLLYIGYTKAQLESVMKQKDFASLPQVQQDKVKSLYEDVGEQELLVMILE